MSRSTSLSNLILAASVTACFAMSSCQSKSEIDSPEAFSSQTSEAQLAELSDILGYDVKSSFCTAQNPAQSAKKMSTNLPQQNSSVQGPQSPSGQIMDHSHVPIEVPDGIAVPRLSLSLTPDVMSGYNLKIKTENYAFMPPPFEGQTMDTLMTPVTDPDTGFVQGHAHLYVNGVKIQRIYGENIHLPESLFRNGMNQLNVTLNNHAHMFWTNDDKEIISSMFINTNLPQLVMHQFDSVPVEQK